MKLIILATATTLIATVSFAEQSDRYHDLRLDTSQSATVYAQGAGPTRPDSRPADLWLETFADRTVASANLSTRNARSNADDSSVYGGYGPFNDSR